MVGGGLGGRERLRGGRGRVGRGDNHLKVEVEKVVLKCEESKLHINGDDSKSKKTE